MKSIYFLRLTSCFSRPGYFPILLLLWPGPKIDLLALDAPPPLFYAPNMLRALAQNMQENYDFEEILEGKEPISR